MEISTTGARDSAAGVGQTPRWGLSSSSFVHHVHDSAPRISAGTQAGDPARHDLQGDWACFIRSHLDHAGPPVTLSPVQYRDGGAVTSDGDLSVGVRFYTHRHRLGTC